MANSTDASNQWFSAVDGHWNPDGHDHAGHDGDMPSLLVNAAGSAEMELVTGRFDPDAAR